MRLALLFIRNDIYHIGLGHTRLSIIDLDVSSNQPILMVSKQNVFNGDIQFSTTQKKLLLKGEKFHTNSDTEVLIES